MTSAKASDDLNQVIGIVCGRRSEIQHVIVACALALDPNAVRGVPNHRIEPIDAANELAQNLPERIVPFDVRHLMSQNQPASQQRPFPGSGGQQNNRRQDSAR